MKEKIEDVLQVKGISKNQLAIKMGINPCHLYNALNGKEPMYPRYKKQISEILDVPEDVLFNEVDNE